jgi:hypothetical protein
MGPNEISSFLFDIADYVDFHDNPSRIAVASDLRSILASLEDDDLHTSGMKEFLGIKDPRHKDMIKRAEDLKDLIIKTIPKLLKFVQSDRFQKISEDKHLSHIFSIAFKHISPSARDFKLGSDDENSCVLKYLAGVMNSKHDLSLAKDLDKTLTANPDLSDKIRDSIEGVLSRYQEDCKKEAEKLVEAINKYRKRVNYGKEYVLKGVSGTNPREESVGPTFGDIWMGEDSQESRDGESRGEPEGGPGQSSDPSVHDYERPAEESSPPSDEGGSSEDKEIKESLKRLKSLTESDLKSILLWVEVPDDDISDTVRLLHDSIKGS